MTDADLNLSNWVNPRVLSEASILADKFTQAEPFRHIVIDDFLIDDCCQRLINEFPDFDEKLAINEDGLVGAKAVREQIRVIGPAFCALDDLSKSASFMGLISAITSIPELQHDPYYFGGGTHENRDGQSLDAHVDFNYHPVTRQHRRLNLIVYLNPDWEDCWGGSLQFHRDPYLPPSQDDIKLVTPKANRCVIFETTECSWHGFKRIRLPESKKQVSRKSFALYYYTDTRPPAETGPEHSTIYVPEHLPEWYTAGMTLEAEELHHIRNLVTSRNQHLKRLYENIIQLNQQINDLRYRLESAAELEKLPAIQNDIDYDQDADIKCLSAKLQEAQLRVCELEESTSWRITAPLRAIKRALIRT